MKEVRAHSESDTDSSMPPRKRVNLQPHPDEVVFAKIIESLKTTSVPAVSCFRVKEKKEILQFIVENLEGRNESSTMIVFGQPGLGKTLVLKEMMNDFTKNQRRKGRTQKLEKPQTIYVNAMNYANCSRFIEDLADKFNADKARPGIQFRLEALRKALEVAVQSAPVLLLIDELETLSFHESDFCFVFELLSIRLRGFVKIGISNTLELFTPAQDKGVIYLSFRFLVFKPYDAEQLKGLLVQRLQKADRKKALWVWPSSSIEFLVKKAITGQASDVRFLLAAAQEITEQKLQKFELQPVSIPELVSFLEKKLKTSSADVMPRLSFHAHVLLLSLYEKLSSTAECITVEKLAHRFKEALDVIGLDASERISDLLETLETYSFIKIEKSSKRGVSTQTVRSSLPREELRQLLSQVDLLKRFLQQ